MTMIGRIYKIIHTQSDLMYIGSTTKSLKCRWQGHKNGYNTWDKSKKCVSIYDHFKSHGIDNFQIELIKEYEVVDRAHLRAYEQIWMNKFKSRAVNKYHALDLKPVSRNNQITRNREYRQTHKDISKAYMKQYYQENKEKFVKTIIDCGCGGVYSNSSRSRHNITHKHEKWLASLN